MASAVDICNLALLRLGETSITSITSPTNEKERKLAVLYPHWRDIEQSSYSWPFGRKQVALASTGNTPELNWTYEYQLPSDFLGFPQAENDVHFEIQSDKVLSNESSFTLCYSAKITDTLLFSREFVELLVARLALELAYSLTDSAALTTNMFELYKKAETKARNISSLNRGQNRVNQRDSKNDFAWISAGRS